MNIKRKHEVTLPERMRDLCGCNRMKNLWKHEVLVIIIITRIIRVRVMNSQFNK